MRLKLWILIALAAVNAHAQRPIEIEDYFRVAEVSDPRVSPDGQWVLYSASSRNQAADRRESNLWLVKWDGSQSLQITYSGDGASSARWSPDGRYVSFLSSRPGKAKGTQIWLLDRQGGEARQLTDFKGRIGSYEWSPDSKRLALVLGEPPADPAQAANQPIVIDRYQFKRDISGYVAGNPHSRIHLYDVASGKLEALTSDKEFDEEGPAWSPDGSRIAFVSNHDANWDRTRNSDMFVVDARPGSVARKLTTFAGTDGGRLAWSPDGSLIAYGQGSEPKFNFHSLNRLAVVPAAGGPARVLTQQLDRGTSSPFFSADGKSIYFLVTDDRSEYLARIPAAGGPVERLTTGARVVQSVSAEAGHTALLSSSDIQPAEVFALEGSQLRRLTHHNDALTADVRLVPAEDISFPSKDGTEVHALLTKPLSYEVGRRYPTLVRIHGGPTAQDAHSFAFERQLFAAAGYVVLNVNYRGSSGRGARYSESIFADWGNKEVDDVLAAVDYAVSKGIADPDRLGIGGWSYGGVLTDYVIASDTRFKAAISGAGSANHISLYGHDQYTFLYDNEFGPPWKNTELWLKFSYPFFHADRIRTPTLFVGGEKDFNVPILGGEQMYQALQTLNVPTQLVIYPGQFHRIAKFAFVRDQYQRYLAWYDKYLKGPAPATTSSAR